MGGGKFVETVQEGLGWKQDSSVWRLLCASSLIVYLVAVISAKLNKSDDLATRIGTAGACNAALEGLRADVEFGKLPVKVAVGEYGQIFARILLVSEDSADDTDPNGGARAGVVIPGLAIVLAGVVLVTTMIGFVLGGLGGGVAAAGPLVRRIPSHCDYPTGTSGWHRAREDEGETRNPVVSLACGPLRA